MLDWHERLRAERRLIEEDLSGMKISDVRRLAMLAWNDPARASRFVSRLEYERLDAVER